MSSTLKLLTVTVTAPQVNTDVDAAATPFRFLKVVSISDPLAVIQVKQASKDDAGDYIPLASLSRSRRELGQPAIPKMYVKSDRAVTVIFIIGEFDEVLQDSNGGPNPVVTGTVTAVSQAATMSAVLATGQAQGNSVGNMGLGYFNVSGTWTGSAQVQNASTNVGLPVYDLNGFLVSPTGRIVANGDYLVDLTDVNVVQMDGTNITTAGANRLDFELRATNISASVTLKPFPRVVSFVKDGALVNGTNILVATPAAKAGATTSLWVMGYDLSLVAAGTVQFFDTTPTAISSRGIGIVTGAEQAEFQPLFKTADAKGLNINATGAIADASVQVRYGVVYS